MSRERPCARHSPVAEGGKTRFQVSVNIADHVVDDRESQTHFKEQKIMQAAVSDRHVIKSEISKKKLNKMSITQKKVFSNM